MQTGDLKKEIGIEDYTNGREDEIKEMVNMYWDQLMAHLDNEEEIDKAFEELVNKIEEHEKNNIKGMSR